MELLHFGIKIKNKPSNRLSKELYLSAKPEGMRGWEEKHYEHQKVKASLNYDLNMRFFESLDFAIFNSYIEEKVKKHKFIECIDLKELSNTTGLYMMVLDKYKQVYIGISGDIKRRIQNHWNRRKSLERLIFGDVFTSIIPIDSFGALDTTRIFYIKNSSIYKLEEKIVKDFQGLYLLNRSAGGIGSSDTYTDSKQMALIATLANRVKRNLIPFTTLEELKNIFTEKQLQFYYRQYPELKMLK